METEEPRKLPPEQAKLYQQYVRLASDRRGALINETILLERLVDDYIASYFCKDFQKKKELMELIICTNRMIFENKMQVAKCLLERHNPEILSKHPKLITDIVNTIIVERNVLAHYWLVTSNELFNWIKESKSVFVKFRNTIEYIEYDKKNIQKLHSLIAKYIAVFIDIQNNNT